jgi:hypothetical protein
VGHDEGGYFSVWDRENKQEVRVDLPLRFVYLDTRKAIGGYYEAVGRSFFSNEVKPFSNEEFDVRYYKDGNSHPVAKGKWSDIKGEVGGKGGKYVNVVYATLLGETVLGENVLVKLPLLGAAGSVWIDLEIKDGESFEVSGYVDATKGRNKYRAPVIAKIDITDEEGAIADEHDGALQAYFGAKSEPVAKGDDDKPPVTDEQDLTPADEDDFPF